MITPGHALHELDSALAQFRLGEATLVPDLALLGLGLTVQSQAEAALALSKAAMHEPGMANARVAFEAAQQALVLATQEDYPAAGVRAWIYFARKDRDLGIRAVGAAAEEQYGRALESVRAAAEAVHPASGELFKRAAEALDRQPRRPDNWLGGDMAAEYGDAFQKVVRALGREPPMGLADAERSAYHALCRSAHARPALYLKGVARLRDGSLFAELDEPPEGALRANLELAVAGAVMDGVLALCYRLAMSEAELGSGKARRGSEKRGGKSNGT